MEQGLLTHSLKATGNTFFIFPEEGGYELFPLWLSLSQLPEGLCSNDQYLNNNIG
jgi:hypothetical protein